MDAGGLAGRSAMLAITTGCYPEMVAPDGLLGDLNVSLWHLHSGTLAYAGCRVLPPFVAWSIHYTTPEQRAQYLHDYAARMRTLETTEPLFFHPLSDFDDWRLKAGIEPKTVGQRRAAP
jgi:NAD(P)H dehydrogenase (quinone)